MITCRSKFNLCSRVFIAWNSKGLFAHSRVVNRTIKLEGPPGALFYLLTLDYDKPTKDKLFTPYEQEAAHQATAKILNFDA